MAYYITVRPALGASAEYKRVTQAQELSQWKTYGFAEEWIKTKGDKANVYKVYRRSDNKLIGTWVFDEKRDWHTTKFVQQTASNGKVLDRVAKTWGLDE